MALKGNFKYYTSEESKTETRTVQATIAEDVPEWHPDYEFRGQTIDKTFPVVYETETTINDSYVQIISFMFHKRMNTSEDLDEHEKDETLDLYFRVYASEEARRNNFNEFLYEEHILSQQITQNPGDDIRTLGYELLKQQRGFDEMVDAL